MKKAIPSAIADSINPMLFIESVMQVSELYMQWKTVQEQERTQRAAIEAKRDVLLKKIRADREIMLTVLRGRFEQQADALSGLFRNLDTAVAANNADLVAPILNAIVETVKTSPLGDLKTLDQRMNDGSFTFVLGDK